MPNDLIGFDIPGLMSAVEDLHGQNEKNRENKTKLEDHIRDNLEPLWTTEGGKEAIKLLRKFIDEDYDQYIETLATKITNLENTIPRLNNIDRA